MPTSASPVAPIIPTPRLSTLPTYVFAWLDELKAAARARGADLIDLGMGNPDRPTPQAIVDAVAEAYQDPRTHGYPPFRGTPRFLQAAAAYLERRFGVTVDPERELLCVSGGKEGIAHLTMAFVDEHCLSLVPDIYYPVHARATGLTGGRVHWMPITEARGYLPDLGAIPDDVLQRARVMILNYPHNPTGATAPKSFLEEAVAFCRQHGIVLVSDLAYAEVTFDGYVAPSVLEVPGAKDVAVEFHSLSKTFNMAGARLGFAAGGAAVMDALYAVRTNMGYGTPATLQAGGAYALDHLEELSPPVVEHYRQRRDVVVEGFRSLGWDVTPPPATMFVWMRVPAGFTAPEFAVHLIDRCDVVITPGHAFGPGGEGYFRVSLVAEPERLRAAIERLRAAGIRGA